MNARCCNRREIPDWHFLMFWGTEPKKTVSSGVQLLINDVCVIYDVDWKCHIGNHSAVKVLHGLP